MVKFVRTAVVTGSNRGVGLEVATQLLQREVKVIATCRQPDLARDLQVLKVRYAETLEIVQLDIAEPGSISNAAMTIRNMTEASISFLFNVAGVNNLGRAAMGDNLGQAFGELDFEQMTRTYAVNAVGPLILIQEIADLLPGARIVNVSSSMGSNGLMTRGNEYAYRASKAALNIISHALSFDLRAVGAIVVAMHPGWVKTDMGSSLAPYPLADNVQLLIDVVERLALCDSGKYLNWKGDELPW